MTQAAFCCALSSLLPHRPNEPDPVIRASSLAGFRSKGGKRDGSAAVDGADSLVFYAAYVFFEKERLLSGGRKGKGRLGMEEVWGEGGMERVGCKSLLLGPGESAGYDRFGRLLVDGVVCR